MISMLICSIAMLIASIALLTIMLNVLKSLLSNTVFKIMLASGEKGHSGSGKKGQLVVG